MDSGPAPPSSFSASPQVPADLYQPLLLIAQLGYDDNDVRHWFPTVLRHWRRMSAQNAEVASTIGTPVSDSELPLSRSEDDSGSVYPTTESSEDHVSPRTLPIAWTWSRSTSYEPSICEQSDLMANSAPQSLFDFNSEELQQSPLQIPQITPTQQSFNQEHGMRNGPQGTLMMSADYSPAVQHLDMDEINASRSQSLTFPVTADQWLSNEEYPLLQQQLLQQQPQFAHPWPSMLPTYPSQAPYQMATMASQSPLLVPYTQSAPLPQRRFTEGFAGEFVSPFAPAPGGSLSQLATHLYHSPFFPTIDVIPSRKKRKLKGGVRRIAQSLGSARRPSA